MPEREVISPVTRKGSKVGSKQPISPGARGDPSCCRAEGVPSLPSNIRVSRHIAPLPRSLWNCEVVGWVVRCAWLNQNNVFVGIMRAQRIEHAPSRDASILNLCFSGSGHGHAPAGCRIGGSTTSLSAIGARRFVVLFSADDDRQFAPFAPCSLVPRGAADEQTTPSNSSCRI
jgi:hypothetical protein